MSKDKENRTRGILKEVLIHLNGSGPTHEVYPLPTKIICDRPNLIKHVASMYVLMNNLSKSTDHINPQAHFDISVVELVCKIYDDGYNTGLKHMDQMHQLTENPKED